MTEVPGLPIDNDTFRSLALMLAIKKYEDIGAGFNELDRDLGWSCTTVAKYLDRLQQRKLIRLDKHRKYRLNI